ncbi:hypothetical protein B0H16DRAFT_1460921 [Mycena metata]|uniref:Uncharacterized protein n=1 Tax=Mycena metata TaxID=1033252 RepID=A0AAD7N8A9_9AGAR|nr:hypothetical protein B0H16DRAFT_1460921 [Mycena metata]
MAQAEPNERSLRHFNIRDGLLGAEMVPTTEPFLVLIRSQLHALPFSHKVQKGDEVCTKAQARVERAVSAAAASKLRIEYRAVQRVPTTEPFSALIGGQLHALPFPMKFEKGRSFITSRLKLELNERSLLRFNVRESLLDAELVPTTKSFSVLV